MPIGFSDGTSYADHNEWLADSFAKVEQSTEQVGLPGITLDSGMKDKYNTQLSPDDETKFQDWAKQNPGLGSTYDYDARGFWQAGAGTADNGHGGDTWKKPNHPTFSDQSMYNGVDGYQGGKWGNDGAEFSPSETNIKNLGKAGLQNYFSRIEPNTALRMPLGGSTEPAGALKPPGGTETPDKAQLLEKGYLKALSGTDNPRPVLDILMDFAKEKATHVLDALKAPGDAWAGKLDPMSTQGLERATTLAGLMVGGPAPVAAKMADGTLGSFAGVTSKTLDKSKLYKAQNMELEAAHPDDIWKETGFFRGADSRWRYEIPDETANILDKGTILKPAEEPGKGIESWTKIEKPATIRVKEDLVPADRIDDYLEGKFEPKKTYLEDVLHHPELYKAYPALKDIEVFPMPAHLPYNGMVRDGQIFMRELTPDEFQSTLLHEVQHVIQVGEGFARGGNPSMFTPPGLEAAKNMWSKAQGDMIGEFVKTGKVGNAGEVGSLQARVRAELEDGTFDPGDKLKKFKEDYPEDYQRLVNIEKGRKLLQKQADKQDETYRRLMGEVESRNVQARMDMGQMERFLKNPRTTEDRPRFVQVDPATKGDSAATGTFEPTSPRWANNDNVRPLNEHESFIRDYDELVKLRESLGTPMTSKLGKTLGTRKWSDLDYHKYNKAGRELNKKYGFEPWEDVKPFDK